MISTMADLRDEVRELAEEAFHQKLISGYGDGSNRPSRKGSFALIKFELTSFFFMP